MTDYSKLAKNAAEKTDAQLADSLDKLKSVDVKKLIANTADAAKVEQLVAKIKASTDRNEKLAAYKAVAVTLSADALAVVKKALLCMIAMLSLCVFANAEEAKPMFDFSSFFVNSRIGYSVNQHSERSTVLYSSFKRYSPVANVELLNLNFGYDMSNKHPIVMFGVRLDNADKLIWDTSWAHKHIETAPLPTIELGPHCMAWPRISDGKVKFDFWYGAIVAVGF